MKPTTWATEDLGHRVLGRDADHHVNMIQQQLSLLDFTFTLSCQVVEHVAEMFTDFPKQPLPAIFRNEHNVVHAVPFRVALTFVGFHVSLRFVEL